MNINNIISDVFDDNETCVCYMCKCEYVESLMCEFVFDIDTNNESSYNICTRCSYNEGIVDIVSVESHDTLTIIRH